MEADMQSYRIPKELNALPLVLFWEIDEFFALVISMFVGLIIKHAIIIVGLAFVLISVYRRIKKKKHKGYFAHQIYKAGIITPDHIPPYHIREFTD
jgi:type IV conjugative transfer system protein TraL